MFQSSIVALVTPMTNDRDVDYTALKGLVDYHIQNGTQGIISVGTTGESSTLSFEEHIKVVEKTIEFAEGKVPIIAGTGANSTEEAIYLNKLLEKSGTAAYLSVVPYYNKPEQKGLIAHFEAIADATSVPIILYNVPGRTVTDLLPETVAVLAKHPNIIGLKDATGNLSVLKQLKAVVPDDFLLYSGDDESSLEFMLQGGHGVMSVTANVVPKYMRQMCDDAKSGNESSARQINERIGDLHTLLFVESNPVLPKFGLHQMGLIASENVRLPLVGAELVNQEKLKAVLSRLELI
jgi:4-hydroxy-tetrahydrodipicolinate synthase